MICDRAADAKLGLLAGIAFDMFKPGILEPEPDPRLSPEWIIRGYLTAADALLAPKASLGRGSRVFYGFLAEALERPGEFVAVIRGTADLEEWILDGRFWQVTHPAGGHAEAGFYGIFSSMLYHALDGTDSPVGPGIAKAVGEGAVTVIGHSLGAALASYAALDLALDQGMGARVRARIFASPRPGDQGFADAFAAHVTDAVAYAGQHDLVTEVPEGFGYLPLHCLQIIGGDVAQAIIKDTPACWHHIVSYCSSLDYRVADWSAFPTCDESLTACILGPSPLLSN